MTSPKRKAKASREYVRNLWGKPNRRHQTVSANAISVKVNDPITQFIEKGERTVGKELLRRQIEDLARRRSPSFMTLRDSA
jgi:hypothetical protein